MATNNYVTINSKRYAVSTVRYEPTMEKAQRVHVTVGGSHIAQDFNLVEYRWGFDLVVAYTGAGAYGGLSDIKTAYGLSSCAFTDHYGNNHNVYFEGPLSEKPWTPMIDGTAVFLVSINLRKKQ